MNEFERCLNVIFGNEGGYSDHPADRGGKTNMGITGRTLKKAKQLGLVGHYDVKALTREEAKRIYETLYWGPSKADKMPWPLDLLHFDAAVHHGVGGAGRLLQKAINVIYNGKVLKVDGAVGPLTLSHMAPCLQNRMRSEILCREQLSVRRAFFRKIVERKPGQDVFLKGWENRLRRLERIVDEEFS